MSKDERYDVTQHDGITEGKWEIRHSGTCIDVVVYADDEKRAFSPIINFTRELGHLVMKIDRDRADLEAIASLPEILDALKKAYEENDARIDEMDHIVDAINTDQYFDEVLPHLVEGGHMWECLDCNNIQWVRYDKCVNCATPRNASE
jgi:hypothetical protein